jgi:hypothetical protein
MKRSIGFGIAFLTLCALTGISVAAETPAAAPTPASAPAPVAKPADNPPMVPPAGPGVYSQAKKGANGFHLAVTGHKFSTRSDIEKYLAYRAAELALERKATWFTFVEDRAKGDTAPVPKRDPAALRYSFRMEFWRPVWRYKTKGSPAWKSWSPFAGAAFIADDPKSITDFEVSADIVLHKGPMDDANPLAFEPGAVSDLLVNQVSPPE